MLLKIIRRLKQNKRQAAPTPADNWQGLQQLESRVLLSGTVIAWGDDIAGGSDAPTDSGYTQIVSHHGSFAALKSAVVANVNDAPVAVADSTIRLLLGTEGTGPKSPAGRATSVLVELDPATGLKLRDIGEVGYLVNGLEYDHSTSTLYGTTSANDATAPDSLITISMDTGSGTVVGSAGRRINNPTVNSSGDLFGWSEWKVDRGEGDKDNLVQLDKVTGAATLVGNNDKRDSYRHGLAFDKSDTLYFLNGDGVVYTINETTGDLSEIGDIGIPQVPDTGDADRSWGRPNKPAHHGDVDPYTGLYYGLDSIMSSGPRNLVTIDLATRTVGASMAAADTAKLHTLSFVAGATLLEGGTTTVLAGGATSVLDNDSDAEGDPHTAVLVSDVTNGSLALNSDGTFSYTHDGSQTTVDSFTYKANDGALDSNVVEVTIAITPVNDAPTGSVTISGTFMEGQVLTVSNDLADADGIGGVSYQWNRDGAVADGVTGLYYMLTQADVGKVISVTASYIDGEGTAESVASAPAAVVTSADPPVLAGDVDNDGHTNNLDITPFISALQIGGSIDGPNQVDAFLAQVPGGSFASADASADGLVNNLDITPFISLLSQSVSAVSPSHAATASVSPAELLPAILARAAVRQAPLPRPAAYTLPLGNTGLSGTIETADMLEKL